MYLPLIFTSIILISTFVLLAFLFKLGLKNTKDDSHEYQLPKDEMKKFILWKSFYVNPEDPRGLVPKTWGGGITVNFRNKKNIYIFLSILFIIIFASLGLIISVSKSF